MKRSTIGRTEVLAARGVLAFKSSLIAPLFLVEQGVGLKASLCRRLIGLARFCVSHETVNHEKDPLAVLTG